MILIQRRTICGEAVPSVDVVGSAVVAAVVAVEMVRHRITGRTPSLLIFNPVLFLHLLPFLRHKAGGFRRHRQASTEGMIQAIMATMTVAAMAVMEEVTTEGTTQATMADIMVATAEDTVEDTVTAHKVVDGIAMAMTDLMSQVLRLMGTTGMVATSHGDQHHHLQLTVRNPIAHRRPRTIHLIMETTGVKKTGIETDIEHWFGLLAHFRMEIGGRLCKGRRSLSI
jgi:hypothetical protein